jgi:uncharacterized protein (DUF4213/DUF364 family)
MKRIQDTGPAMDARCAHGEGIEPSDAILDEAADALAGMYGDKLASLIIERLVVGVFFVGVKLSNGCAGVAYNPPEVVKSAGNRILKGPAPMIRGMAAADAAGGDIPGPFAGVIRLAVLNALSVPFLRDRDGRYRMDIGSDLSQIPALFKNRRVCMVGAIIPLLKRLKDLQTAEVVIIDRKKETQAEAEAGYGEFVRPENTARALAGCQTAVFTGAAVANRTIAELIGWVPPDAAIAIVGPSAAFVPDPLFRRNVAAVATAMVTHGDLALEILAEGGGGYRILGSCARKINLLNMDRLRQLGLT